MNGKKLYPSKFVNYLGVLIDSHLNFSFHFNSISTRLSRAIGMLAKIRYVTKDTFRSIYSGIFSSILTYGCQIWGQIKNKHFIRLVTLQNRAIKIINFVNFRETASPLYLELKILKLSNNIRLQHFLYVIDDINNNLPPPLNNTFQLASISHDHTTRSSSRYTVRIPAVKTTVYGLRSIKSQACHELF